MRPVGFVCYHRQPTGSCSPRRKRFAVDRVFRARQPISTSGNKRQPISTSFRGQRPCYSSSPGRKGLNISGAGCDLWLRSLGSGAMSLRRGCILDVCLDAYFFGDGRATSSKKRDKQRFSSYFQSFSINMYTMYTMYTSIKVRILMSTEEEVGRGEDGLRNSAPLAGRISGGIQVYRYTCPRERAQAWFPRPTSMLFFFSGKKRFEHIRRWVRSLVAIFGVGRDEPPARMHTRCMPGCILFWRRASNVIQKAG